MKLQLYRSILLWVCMTFFLITADTSEAPLISISFAEMQEVMQNQGIQSYVYFGNESESMKNKLPIIEALKWANNLEKEHTFNNLHAIIDRLNNDCMTAPSNILLKAIEEALIILNSNQHRLDSEMFIIVANSLSTYGKNLIDTMNRL